MTWEQVAITGINAAVVIVNIIVTRHSINTNTAMIAANRKINNERGNS